MPPGHYVIQHEYIQESNTTPPEIPYGTVVTYPGSPDSPVFTFPSALNAEPTTDAFVPAKRMSSGLLEKKLY